mmetsp:Transcript_3976/g.5527  ORF Transcript_3976/g.5527 Transcript_3976/m.5527 type:complete len:350 (-) Transcript_3976:399-1448(-)
MSEGGIRNDTSSLDGTKSEKTADTTTAYESVYLQQILFEIVKDGFGDLEQLEDLLRQGTIFDLVNSKEQDTGMSALHYACALGKKDMATMLLDAGADALGVLNKHGKTALHSATQYGKINTFMEVVRYFPIECFEGVGSETLIQTAAQFGQARMLKCLLDRRAGFHERNKLGETAMHLAAKFDHPACIKLLAKAGAHIDPATFDHGHTPLHYAAMHGNLQAALALQVMGADLHFKNTLPLQRTPLEAAKDCGHWQLYNALLKEDRRLLKVEYNRLKDLDREAENQHRDVTTRAFKVKNQYIKIKTELTLKQEYEKTLQTNEEERRRRLREVQMTLSSNQKSRQVGSFKK